MMAALKELNPGRRGIGRHFVRNRSEQFEARPGDGRDHASPSLFFDGMAGSRMPIVTAMAKAAPSFREISFWKPG